MKVLRAIGGFFAKIGRWIANTAWIQPLLIVGGIFGIIFSIPYIKKGIEGLQTDTTDHDYQYYSNHALSLTGENSKAEKLLSYLEEEKFTEIKSEFGEKFFLTFVEKSCANCKECVAGYKQFANNFNSLVSDKNEQKFKLYTILVDKKDSDGKYLAKEIMKNHQELFDNIVEGYCESTAATDPNTGYSLYKNASGSKSSLMEKIKSLQTATQEDSSGLSTPTTFMIDVSDKGATKFNVSGITAIFFNYNDFITGDVNKTTKSYMLRDCWTYQNLFDITKQA